MRPRQERTTIPTMRKAVLVAVTVLALNVFSACSSGAGTQGVVVGVNDRCVWVEVSGRPNRCVPPDLNADAKAAKVGDCFVLEEDASEYLTSAHREDCPSR